jgi:sugar/nucleoside kinase (ribokinase family)
LIAIVGNINVDYKTGSIPADPRIFVDGETSIGEIYESVGGGGANTAVAASRMGGQVVFCGAIGNDALGRRLEAFLVECGIRPQLAVKTEPTGRSLALNWERNQRHFISCHPSALMLAAADIDLAAFEAQGCRHLYRADIWFGPRLLQEGNLRLFQDARRRGMDVSVDINWDPHWHAGRDDRNVRERIDAVARTLPHVTYAHGNERELLFFAGRKTMPEAAAWFFSHGVSTLIVHRGALGSSALTADGKTVDVPAVSVSRIVSEAGTGDVFTAAFLLREAMPMTQRLAECNAVAARHLSGESRFIPPLG